MFSFHKINSCSFLIAYFGTETLFVNKQETDKEGHILILYVSINDSEYILINANTEKEQLDILNNMFVLLEKFDINKKTANYGGRF